jgi:uncharacterized protein
MSATTQSPSTVKETGDSMVHLPKYPDFKIIEISDLPVFHEFFAAYQPDVSEYTFINLYAWRSHYNVYWCIDNDILLIAVQVDNERFYGANPIGPGSRSPYVVKLLEWLREVKGESTPVLERTDTRLIKELDQDKYIITEDRDQFDYVYKTSDLISLAGRKYHAKKNHINKFQKSYDYEFRAIDDSNIDGCFSLLSEWCDYRECWVNPEIQAECQASREMLTHSSTFGLKTGVIMLNGKVEAFTIGELLNYETGVVHIEKANPEIPGIYTMINQQFCEKVIVDVPFINREQDAGQPGLRQAKLSYKPIHLIKKYILKAKF